LLAWSWPFSCHTITIYQPWATFRWHRLDWGSVSGGTCVSS